MHSLFNDFKEATVEIFLFVVFIPIILLIRIKLNNEFLIRIPHSSTTLTMTHKIYLSNDTYAFIIKILLATCSV